LLVIFVEVHELDGVSNDVELELVVERRVGGERGRVVDLQQPDFVLVVDNYVHSEDLEAHVVFVVVGLATLVVVRQNGLGRD